MERVRAHLDRAARAHLEADVPRCSLLSGGLDSTVLTAVLADELRRREGPDARIRSYSVDYSDQAEQFTGDALRTGHDTPYAAEAGAFIGTDHSTIVLDPHTLLDPEHRRAVVVARDSPVGVGDMDTSLYLLFGEIRRTSTVAVSGEAADELFGGYPWFHTPRALAARTFPWLLVTGDEAAVPLHPDLAATLRVGEFRDDTYRDALAAVPHLDGEDAAEHRQREMQHLSLTRWLRQLLHRKDRLSMAQGIEVRVPYCDHRLVEYVFSVPWSCKSFDGREKSLLRAAGGGLAPASVLTRLKNHYPATHHPDYNRGLQEMARDALDAHGGRVRDLVDESRLKPRLDASPDRLEWGHRLRFPSGVVGWLVTGYHAAHQSLNDSRLGKSHALGNDRWRRLASIMPEPQHSQLQVHLLHQDPPRHTAMRRLLLDAFAPRRVEAIRPRFQRLADALVDAMPPSASRPTSPSRCSPRSSACPRISPAASAGSGARSSSPSAHRTRAGPPTSGCCTSSRATSPPYRATRLRVTRPTTTGSIPTTACSAGSCGPGMRASSARRSSTR
nr:asparagine synthase-related protein [Protofrankia coriariae]